MKKRAFMKMFLFVTFLFMGIVNVNALEPLQNVSLEGNVLTFDEFAGADSYYFRYINNSNNSNTNYFPLISTGNLKYTKIGTKIQINIDDVLDNLGAKTGTHKIHVRAYSTLNNSFLSDNYVVSNTYSYTSPLSQIANPEKPVLSNDGKVTWNAVTNAAVYEIQLYNQSDENKAVFYNTNMDTGILSFNIPIGAFTSADSYKVRIMAKPLNFTQYLESDYSNFSDLVSFSENDIAIPKINNISLSKTGILSWDNVPNASLYEVWYSNYSAVSTSTESINLSGNYGNNYGEKTIKIIAKGSGNYTVAQSTGTFNYVDPIEKITEVNIIDIVEPVEGSTPNHLSVIANPNTDITIVNEFGFYNSILCNEYANYMVPYVENDTVYFKVELQPNPGFDFDSNTIFKYKGVEIDKNMITVTGNVYKIILPFTVKPLKYDFTNGENLSTKNLDELSFRIDADYSLFSTNGKVYVDNVLLTNTQYISKSGSTIITLDEEYAASLSKGNHTIRVEFNNGGEAETTFTIEDSFTPVINPEETPIIPTREDIPTTEVVGNPQTGDNIALSIALGFISLIGLISAVIYTKKRFN